MVQTIDEWRSEGSKLKMKYNPHIHHRRSIRLKGYDYSQAGAYFITICCEGRQCRFGKIENDKMILNEYGIIAYNEWNKLSTRFLNFESDVFQIMPNHMHGIIVMNDFVGVGFTPTQNNTTDKTVEAGFTPAQNNWNGITGQPQGLPLQNTDNEYRAGASPALYSTNTTIGDIAGVYKSLVANACLDIYKSKNERMGKLWQRNYFEHIIRNEQSYQTISDYIIHNPAKWNDDKFYKN